MRRGNADALGLGAVHSCLDHCCKPLRYQRLPRWQAALVDALDGTDWVAAGPPVGWFYDPPWTIPFFRRNEVAVPVAPR